MSKLKTKTLEKSWVDLLEQFASVGAKPLSEMSPIEGRELSASLSSLSGAPPTIASETEEEIVADGGTFNIRILKPEGNASSVIVYYHGGGWVIGDVYTYDTFAKTFAIATQSIVVLVNYRKAPEFRYPFAVNDAYSALQWVSTNIESIAGKKLPIIVAGDSAGGNLSAVVAQRARNEDGPDIAIQILVYPVTNYNLETASYNAPENQLILSKDSMIWFYNHYVDEKDRKNVDVSPLLEQDLSGLPPAIVLTAGFDPLHDEGVAYASALVNAEVPVIFKDYEDQSHNFFVMPKAIPRSEEAIKFIANAISLILNTQQ